MKKILLSLVALMAMTISASAQDSYTASGYVRSAIDENLDTLAIGGYSWDTYSPLVTFDEPRTVEVCSDSIIVKDWYGYGNTSVGAPYDLVCYLDNGHITKYSAKVGDTLYPYYNTYVYTGFSDNYCVYFSPWTEAYAAYTQCVSDASTKSGYLFLYGTEYGSKSKSGYYFISWGDQEFEKGIYTYTAKGPVRSAIEENGDSLVIGNYVWGEYSPLLTLSDRDVEVNSDSIIVKDWYGYGNTSVGAPYDLVCYLDNGHITKYSAKVGDTLYPYYDTYVYTGFSDNYCVYFSPWSEAYAPYTQSVSDAASKSGYLFLYGTEYGSKSKSGYYFLPWGDYKFDVSPNQSTGITNVTAKAAAENAPMYNLAGQRVSSSAKGLVIKNGKKMFIK